jgi:hypothetical protein
MKFVSVKLLSIIIAFAISLTSSAKISRNRLDGGNWNDGFNCQQLLINGVDQGSVKIYAKEIVDGTGDLKYGMTFDFAATPGADLKKVATNISGNKYRVPFRKMLNNSKYVNPFGSSKYITGVLQDETGKQYGFKLVLPYKLFGWTISDEEGNKIVSAMNNSATSRTAAVVAAKYTLKKNYQNYVDAKNYLQALSQSANAYAAMISENEKTLASVQNTLPELRNTATQDENNFNAKKNEVLEAERILNDLLKKETQINSEIGSINEAAEALSKQGTELASQKSLLETKVNDVKRILDAEFTKLSTNAPERRVDIDASKTALFSLNKALSSSNLDKIYP